MERCAHCQTPLAPGERFCSRCGRSQPLSILEAQTSPGFTAPRVKACPRCRATLPENALFCADCGYSMSQPLRPASGGPFPPAFIAPGAAGANWGSGALPAQPGSGSIVPGAPAWPQSGAINVPRVSAGPQSGAVGVPHAPAWPQSGAPGVPGAPAMPQSGAPGVPGAPAGAQSGALGGHGSGAVNTVGKRLGRFVRQKLLGTLHAQIISAIVAVAVVGTTGGVVYVAATHGKSSTSPSFTGPLNSASFMLAVDIKTVDGLGHNKEFQETLIVTNGMVCQARDNGRQNTYTGGYIQVVASLGAPYQEKLTGKCAGTYQNGKLSYTETVSYLENDFQLGVTCTAQTPLVLQQLTGSFTSATQISGSFSAASSKYDCGLGITASFPKKDGTWSGNVT